MPPTDPVPTVSTPPGEAAPKAARGAERGIVTGYVPADRRTGFAAVLALDDILAGIVRTTREPIVGQMRLTWWYDALRSLDRERPVAGEPTLMALADAVASDGVSGHVLSTMIDGWERLLDPDPLDEASLEAFAHRRGATLFAALARLAGGLPTSAVALAGEGWALADLARHMRDPVVAVTAQVIAQDRFAAGFRDRWPRALRPVGMLALLARADLDRPASLPGSPRRLTRLLMHRIWGR